MSKSKRSKVCNQISIIGYPPQKKTPSISVVSFKRNYEKFTNALFRTKSCCTNFCFINFDIFVLYLLENFLPEKLIHGEIILKIRKNKLYRKY